MVLEVGVVAAGGREEGLASVIVAGADEGSNKPLVRRSAFRNMVESSSDSRQSNNGKTKLK